MEKENIYCKQLSGYQELNLELEISKMKRIRDKLRRMPDNKEKYFILNDYKRYYSLLSNFYRKDDFSFEPFDFDWEPIWNKYGMENYAFVYQLGNNLEIINRLFSDAREINWQYGIWKEYDIRKKIDSKMGMLVLEEFFNRMPNNIRNVFRKVVNGNIAFNDTGQSFAYDIRYCDSAKILIGEKLNDYDAYFSIVHEIGHAYYYEVMNGLTKLNGLDNEVASIFMEIIFNNFVDEYLYGMEYGITNLFNRQSLFANLLASQNILLSCANDFKLTEDTITGRMDVSKFTERDKKFLELIGFDMKELFRCGYVKKKELIECFKYTISNLLAIYFADVYRYDQKEGLRMLKDYVMLPPGVTLEEKLRMYDLTGDSYKKMIRKVHEYGKRKYLF